MNKIIRRRPFPTFQLSSFPSLIPYDIFEEIDKMFAGLTDFDNQYSNLSMRKGFPKGDIFMENGNAVIELALAGYPKESLSVRVEENNLIVSADKVSDVENDPADTSKGRSLSRRAFTRTFSNFTNEWDLEAATVEYSNGLLRIEVPKIKPEKKDAKELKISDGSAKELPETIEVEAS